MKPQLKEQFKKMETVVDMDSLIITDIGSTTTKALLLKKIGDSYRFINYTSAYTTVEKPDEDVKIGILNAIRKLEATTDVEILSSSDSLKFKDNITYLSTSSAGGGLQIFVIGLTRADSVKSAKRTAYGVGGVLLDALSIEDGKSSSEKLQILNKAHPDIILFCGGIDNGALYNIYRLAELLKTANIKQKFTDNQNIPLVFAGNKQAVDFIKLVFRNKYDLHIVPNLRPSMKSENLEPAKNKIHDLFLENVMEQAPGYSAVKKLVNVDILPTPSGVLKTLRILTKRYDKVIAFDMGGATTDVYSFIHGQQNRSVSANFGMSYSIGNILAFSDYEKDFEPYLNSISVNFSTIEPVAAISDSHSDSQNGNRSLPLRLKEYFHNYIGNKILYPDFNPTRDIDKYIEHIVAISGIKLSLQQHFENNYKIKEKSLFENIRSFFKNKQNDDIYTLPFDDKKTLRKNDFEMIIGSGGVISHASREQVIFILIESFKPSGLVELWRDKHFIMPHLGVLSTVNENIAESLLYDECLEKLAVYIRPQTHTLKIKIDHKEHTIKANDLFIYKSEYTQTITISSKDSCLDKKECVLEPNVSLIINTRYNTKMENGKWRMENDRSGKLRLPYSVAAEFTSVLSNFNPRPTYINETGLGEHKIKYLLPYKGSIYVKQGDTVKPETLLWENRFDPPRIYVVLISAMIKRNLTEAELIKGIQIKEKEQIEIGTPLFKSDKTKYFVTKLPGGLGLAPSVAYNPDKELTDEDIQNGELEKIHKRILKGENLYVRKEDEIALSPVRAIVEKIDYSTGTILLYEIQDYLTEHIEIEIAKPLNIQPNEITGYLKRNKGDFIYAGEILATKITPANPLEVQSLAYNRRLLMEYLSTLHKSIVSPYTGNLADINTTTGNVTICYDKEPYQIFSMCYGTVDDIKDEQEISISVNAIKIEGKIGFGTNVGGRFSVYETDTIKSGDIVYSNKMINYDNLMSLKDKGIIGLICDTISYACLKKIIDKDIGVALTGNESLPFSIIILKGFTHKCQLSEDICRSEIDATNAYSGKYVLLQPQTQIRAGAIRPKIYVF